MEDGYFIEDEFIFEKNNCNIFIPEETNNQDNNLAIKPVIEYDETNKNDLKYITYIDHPSINKDNSEKNESNEKNEKNESNDIYEMNLISQIYFGSITVIGLYILFKLLQRSK